MAHPCPWGQVSWQWGSGLPAAATSLLRKAGSSYLPGGAARAEGQGERRALAPPRVCGRPCRDLVAASGAVSPLPIRVLSQRVGKV